MKCFTLSFPLSQRMPNSVFVPLLCAYFRLARRNILMYKIDKLASVFYQFLLVSFGSLGDTKRWWVYPDAGFFSKDTVLDRVEFLFNRTYKKAFGPKTSRIIRIARAQDSKSNDLIQLVDVLLGAIGYIVCGKTPDSPARAALLQHCRERFDATPITIRGLDRLSVKEWQDPDHFVYPK